MNAVCAGDMPADPNRDIRSFAIDSRDVEAGGVFFALSQPDYRNNGFNGDFEDATVFVADAFESGAAAGVVRYDRFEEHRNVLEGFKERIFLVDDVITALQKLANGVYQEWSRPIVAITGSAGKTTAKELTAHVLEHSGKKVLKNKKNYNNGLGHPLTVLELVKDPAYDIAVLEMGMSTPMHEIERLCRITPPDVSVVLNVLPVHIEHLGTIERIRQAKAEIVEGMKVGGTAVLNADDERVISMTELGKGKTVSFGTISPADVSASDIRERGFSGSTFDLLTPKGAASVEFPLTGRHNIMNALAAAAVGVTFEMTVDKISEALASVESPPQRGEVIRFREGFTVINDSYNSNPDALLSMVETLVAGGSRSKRRIVVAGEMLELGNDAAAIHHTTGRKIAEMGVDIMIGVRGYAASLIDGAKIAGLDEALFANDSELAGQMLSEIIAPGDVVLIKGSRGVRTEKVLEKMLEKFEVEVKNVEER